MDSRDKPLTRVYPQLRTVRELLGAKYALDFYQREYQWGEENIEELFNDFENSFTNSYSPDHERKQVANYQHYFLGTIITVTEGALKNIVDGQQRLTTLTLLLVFLYHTLKAENNSEELWAEIQRLIFSVKHGDRTFNIDVPERNECMRSLFESGHYDTAGSNDLSVVNLVNRYNNIRDQFPEQLSGKALPFFVDWLIDGVDLVEIEASTDDAAFTIFETMNDRGVNLSHADMLKGYLLGNINDPDPNTEHSLKAKANTLWREKIFRLIEIGKEKEADFFKDWLRAQYAETMREAKRGALNKDFENIDKFHRWVRDEQTRIGLVKSKDFYDFVMSRFNLFGDYYLLMLESARSFSPKQPFIYYNAHNNFTFQYSLMLAPIRVEDEREIVEVKMRLVSAFIDIFIARRIVNFRTLAYSSIKYTIFNIIKDIRGLPVNDLAAVLHEKTIALEDKFEAISELYMHGQNKHHIHYLLARITAFIEKQSGIVSSFEDYVSKEVEKPFEIEHLWADKYSRHKKEFSSELDFQDYRNAFGDLILLPTGFNQSLSADVYEEKVKHYIKANLLAQSLHPIAYEKNPSFVKFIKNASLPFKSYFTTFSKMDIDERQNLYLELCKLIWSPDLFENLVKTK